MVQINRKIAGAMSAQLDRVNEHANNPMQRLMDELIAIREENRRLKIELESFRSGRLDQAFDPAVMVIGGQAFFTLVQAARKAGVSYWKAHRLVTSNTWKHEIRENGNYLIHADQPLTVPPRKQKSRRAH